MKLPKIVDVAHLVALAAEAERRAAMRYRRLAERARHDRRADLAALFDRLAVQEEGHEARVRELAAASHAPVSDQPMWLEALGESPRPEEAAAELDRLSLYGCLADAVRREDMAFKLYSYLSAEAEDPELRSLAETLAKEELDHAQLLRVARRKAYRRLEASGRRWPKVQTVNGLSDLLRAAVAAEGGFLAELSSAADGSGLAERLARLTRAALPELAAPSAAAAPGASAQELLVRAEEAFEFYDAVTERARWPDLMERAQALSAMSLERIKLLSAAAPRLGGEA